MSLAWIVIKNPKPDAKELLIYLITDLDEPALRTANRYPIRWKRPPPGSSIALNILSLMASILKRLTFSVMPEEIS